MARTFFRAFPLLASLTLSACAGRPAASSPPYLARGDELDSRCRSFTAELAAAYSRLKARVTAEAPASLPKLDPEPPKPAESGYQLLGKLVRYDIAAHRHALNAETTIGRYSWPVTIKILDDLRVRLTALEDGIAKQPDPRPLIDDYRRLADGKANLEENIRYNRNWQLQIATNRARYDLMNKYAAAAMERKDVLAQLKNKEDPTLRARERELLGSVKRGALRATAKPDYVRVSWSQARVRLRVKVYTDIEDGEFRRRIVPAIEKFWRIPGEYEVKVDLHYISPQRLYAPLPPPSRGSAISLKSHVARFPRDGAVITNGTPVTYAESGESGRPFVVIGASGTSEIVLAHEFGHLLGLSDAYLRGYRDLGPDGFEVVEVIVDHSDLMCAPGEGMVQKHHFERVLGK
jgi:hypothetical protein